MITYMSFISLLCPFFNSDVSAGIKSDLSAFLIKKQIKSLRLQLQPEELP